MYNSASLHPLPLPPRDILERHAVHDPKDTRFRACARLLQSLWRDGRQFEMGTYLPLGGEPTQLGSRLADAPARAGFNYLSQDVARLVRRELAYRERGALIEEERAWTNLLSSSALVFNLLGSLKLNPPLAKLVLSQLLSIEIASVDGFWFETSPGRGDPNYIGDHTALDALVAYTTPSGRSGMIGIEVKYAEGPVSSGKLPTPQTLNLAAQSDLFTVSADQLIKRPRIRQFLSEHMLCQAIVHQHGQFDEGHFVIIAPHHNNEIAAIIDDYQECLTGKQDSALPFSSLSLEAVVAAIHDSDMSSQGQARAYAKQLDQRYCDFSPVFDLVDDWMPHRPS